MSASPTSSPAKPAVVVATVEPLPAPASVAEVDASCRLPVLFMFVSAALWLVVGGVFSMLASLRFHSPTMLADCAWLTYGRVHPAHWNSFAYGFAAQAGMGVALWLLARLGRNPLGNPLLLTFGAKLWNLGVTMGVIGILAGDTTGFEFLEMPRYAAGTLFFAYVIIGGTALFNLHERRESSLQVSQWYLLAALLWFPWIYSVANLMLVVSPVRGVMQSLVGWWFANNFVTLWLTPLALAALFYLVPRQANKPLHSHYLALFGFWTLAVFGGWGGVPVNAPLPGWISAVSTSAATVMIVPVLAVSMNLMHTLCGRDKAHGVATGARFSQVSFICFLLAGVLGSLVAVREIGVLLQGSLLTPAIKHLTLYGFVSMALFGAIYYIVPQLIGTELKGGMKTLHFMANTAGVVLVFVLLAAGGIKQGLALNFIGDEKLNFADVSQGTLMFMRGVTLGELVIVLGSLVLAFNLLSTVGGCLCKGTAQLLGCSNCKGEVAK
jgi:cytochrome c oxidase cbb3-type subunit 1